MERLTYVGRRQILGKALKNAAQLLAEEIEHLAPHDSGKLAANIKVSMTDLTATSVMALIGPTTRVFYASFRNWGTRFQGATHFVERAYENVNDKMQAVLEFDLGRFIDEAIRGS